MKMTGFTYMTRRFLGLVFTAAVVAVAFCACNEDYKMTADEEKDDGKVIFHVVTPKSAIGLSRAVWGDEYVAEGGTEFESALLKSQLHVVITDNTCTEEVSVVNLACTNSTDVGTAVRYEFLGRISSDELDKVHQFVDGKLHIIANAGYLPALSGNTAFSLMGQPGGYFNAIPMWGVKTVDFSRMEINKSLDMGDVHLLRALAKVEVINGSDDNNFIANIKSVAITACNTRGYLLPEGWTNVSDTKNLDRNAIRIPEQTMTGPVTFAASGNEAFFYLPELRNSAASGEIRLSIEYETKEGDELTCSDIFFRPYSKGEPDGEPFDLRRNHLYRYTVSMPSSSKVTVIADVIPYSSVELEPEFGL